MTNPAYDSVNAPPDPTTAGTLVELALTDPAKFVKRRRWPSLIADWDYEPMAQWQARAALVALEFDSKPAPSTRWRPIDNAGNVDPQPAPENPDDPDESETGPAEVQG